jgi:hypothetical protein
VYVCSTECNAALHIHPGSSDNLSESAPDVPRRRFSTCGARPLRSERRSMSETVSAKRTTQAGFRMRRTSHHSLRPHSARRRRSETSNPTRIWRQMIELRIFERFRHPAFATFSQTNRNRSPKRIRTNKNLQTRFSALDIPHASGDASISGLRQRLPVYYSRSVGL